jgi:multidrug efflux pump subunit AcrA (membrane-fusion protein)
VRLPILTSELRYIVLPTGGDEGSPVRLRAEFFWPGAEWRGQIVRSEDVIDPRTQMLHVVARVADPCRRVTPGRVTPDQSPPSPAPPLTVGLFVEAEILGSRFEDVVVLPRSALLDGSEVLVVDADERLRARRVEVLRVESERVLLRSGVASGERVAASASAAVDGERVRPRKATEEYLAALTQESE